MFPWQKILEEQRRLKREQEEADTASRRHTGIVPTHHQFITNERFGDLLNININDADKRKSGSEVQYSTIPLIVQNDSYFGGVCALVVRQLFVHTHPPANASNPSATFRLLYVLYIKKYIYLFFLHKECVLRPLLVLY